MIRVVCTFSVSWCPSTAARSCNRSPTRLWWCAGGRPQEEVGRLDKLVRKAASVLGQSWTVWTPVAEPPALNGLLSTRDNPLHLQHSAISRRCSGVSDRLTFLLHRPFPQHLSGRAIRWHAPTSIYVCPSVRPFVRLSSCLCSALLFLLQRVVNESSHSVEDDGDCHLLHTHCHLFPTFLVSTGDTRAHSLEFRCFAGTESIATMFDIPHASVTKASDSNTQIRENNHLQRCFDWKHTGWRIRYWILLQRLRVELLNVCCLQSARPAWATLPWLITFTSCSRNPLAHTHTTS